jgi:hypothetical protein
MSRPVPPARVVLVLAGIGTLPKRPRARAGGKPLAASYSSQDPVRWNALYQRRF